MFGGHLESSVQVYDKLWLSGQSSEIIGQELQDQNQSQTQMLGRGLDRRGGVILTLKYREACLAPLGKGAGLDIFHVIYIVIATMF